MLIGMSGGVGWGPSEKSLCGHGIDNFWKHIVINKCYLYQIILCNLQSEFLRPSIILRKCAAPQNFHTGPPPHFHPLNYN